MKDWYFFLFALVLTWTVMMAVTFGSLLCRSTFGGVWSSIVIDDCGPKWDSTYSHSGVDVEGMLQKTLSLGEVP